MDYGMLVEKILIQKEHKQILTYHEMQNDSRV
jgi:hypothetical protein